MSVKKTLGDDKNDSQMMTGALTSKLTRCVCGKVYDLLLSSTCPSCGVAPTSGSASGRPLFTEADVDPDVQQVPVWIWKAVAFGCALLVGLYLIVSVVSWLRPEKGQEATPAISTVVPRDDGVAVEPSVVTQPDFATHEQQNIPPPNPNAGVDPGLVGLWKLQVGAETWYLAIGKNGKYSFTSRAARGVTYSHAGDFSGRNARWTMHSLTNPWDDAGTYQLVGNQIFTMVGKLGTGQWRRASPEEIALIESSDVKVIGKDEYRQSYQASQPSQRGDFHRDNGILPPRRNAQSYGRGTRR